MSTRGREAELNMTMQRASSRPCPFGPRADQGMTICQVDASTRRRCGRGRRRVLPLHGFPFHPGNTQGRRRHGSAILGSGLRQRRSVVAHCGRSGAPQWVECSAQSRWHVARRTGASERKHSACMSSVSESLIRSAVWSSGRGTCGHIAGRGGRTWSAPPATGPQQSTAQRSGQRCQVRPV